MPSVQDGSQPDPSDEDAESEKSPHINHCSVAHRRKGNIFADPLKAMPGEWAVKTIEATEGARSGRGGFAKVMFTLIYLYTYNILYAELSTRSISC